MLYYSSSLLVLAYFFGVNTPGDIECWEAAVLFAMYFGYCLVMKHNVALYRGTMAWLGHEQLLEEGSEDEANLVLNQASAFLVPCMWRAGVLQTFLDPDTIESSAAIHAVHRLHGNVRQTFKQLDVDGDGSISVDELRGLLEMIGIERVEPAMVAALARKLDKNDNGKIDFHEFSQWYLASEERMKAELHEKFAELDTNRDGTICVPEFTQLLQKLRVKARRGPRRPAALASPHDTAPRSDPPPLPRRTRRASRSLWRRFTRWPRRRGSATVQRSHRASPAAPHHGASHPPSAPPPPLSRAGSLTRRLPAAAAGKAADPDHTEGVHQVVPGVAVLGVAAPARREGGGDALGPCRLRPPRGASCTDALKFYLVRCPAAPLRLHPTPHPTPLRPLPTPRLRIPRACAQVLPLAAVLYLTLPDVRKPRSRKWYAATFVGAVLWIGVFSHLAAGRRRRSARTQWRRTASASLLSRARAGGRRRSATSSASSPP